MLLQGALSLDHTANSGLTLGSISRQTLYYLWTVVVLLN